jgi:putative Mg2+ transporter-C (MgtC) family protein
MTDIASLLASDQADIVLRLGVALAAGVAIGFERSFHGRPAGMRTHALVCLASALLMLLTVYQAQWFPSQAETVRIDPTRMAQGVMTGIGFLGAGVIIKDGVAVRGLTTAASIWITSAIGILAGAGFFFPLLLVTLSTLFALSVLRRVEAVMPVFSYASHSIVLAIENQFKEKDLKDFLSALGFELHHLSYHTRVSAKTVQYDMTIRTRQRNGLAQLNQAWARRADVISYHITPL